MDGSPCTHTANQHLLAKWLAKLLITPDTSCCAPTALNLVELKVRCTKLGIMTVPILVSRS